MSNVRREAGQRTSLGWMLMGLLSLQLAVAVPIAWALDSYFGVNVPASLMFFGNDGWCDVDTEGVGKHCFGDFHERFLIDPANPPPSPNNLELSPIGPLITQIANTLAVFLPSRLVLFLVILVYAACLIAPALWAARGRSWPLGFLIVGITGIAAYPFVVTLDRLNDIALAVPLILAFLVFLATENTRGVVLSVLALTLIKPQFAALYVVLIAHRQIRAAIVGVAGSVASWLVLVVGAGGGDFGRISQWFAAATSYGTGAFNFDIAYFSPVNVSFSRLIFIASTALESIQQVMFGAHIPLWEGIHPSLLKIQGCVFLLGIGILALWGRRIPPVALGIAALVLSMLVFGEFVAPYYLGFALPVCALFLRRASRGTPASQIELDGEIDSWSEQQPRTTLLQRVALVATTLSCSLVVVPLPMVASFGFFQDRFHRVGPIVQNLATASWMVFLVIACGVAVRSFFKERALAQPVDNTQRSRDAFRARLRSDR